MLVVNYDQGAGAALLTIVLGIYSEFVKLHKRVKIRSGKITNVYPSYNSQLWEHHSFRESGHHGESSIQIFYPDGIMGDILVQLGRENIQILDNAHIKIWGWITLLT